MLDQLREFPPVRALRRYRYDRWFGDHGTGWCRGDFGSFAEATAAAPRVRPVGYDNTGGASMYRDRMGTVYSMDYPVLFWLARLYPSGVRHLFDFGGHVGLCWYAWRAHLAERPVARWTVLDLPAVVREGEAIARREGATGLDFTTEFEDASGADVLLANGSLQYLEESFADRVAALPAPPRHVIVNKTPTHPSRTFVTLQHIGVATCPYRIVREGDLPAAMARVGYVQRDAWTNPELQCRLPFQPAAHPITYRGWCFERA